MWLYVLSSTYHDEVLESEIDGKISLDLFWFYIWQFRSQYDKPVSNSIPLDSQRLDFAENFSVHEHPELANLGERNVSVR